MRRPGMGRDKVLATVVALMAQTGVRIGNDRYTEQNGSFGLTTLRDRHASFRAGAVVLSFRGKGGKAHRARVADARLSRLVRRCRDIPGQRLFQYIDARGERRWIDSGAVNRYLQALGGERLSAKTFRTWIASVLALAELRDHGEPRATLTARKRQCNAALANVAERLGNTLAICRKSYVHPALVEAFLNANLPARRVAARHGLGASEADLVSVLQRSPPSASKAA